MRSERLYLTDILEAAEAIGRFIGEIEYSQFIQDELRQSAVIHKILIIGEAAGHISEDTCRKYPEVEWPKVVGMRHILIHGYFGIDLDIVWRVAIRRIPELHQQINKIIQQEFGKS